MPHNLDNSYIMTIAKNSLPLKDKKNPAPRKIRRKLRPRNAITHGAFADPISAYRNWRKNNRPYSDRVDEIYNKYAELLGLHRTLADPRKKTLRILAVKCVSRELAQGIAVQKGMTMPIRSGTTGKTMFLRVHNLFTRSLKIDEEIQVLLCELGLLAQRE